MLAIVAIAFLLVVAALPARKRPALGRVNIVDLTDWAVRGAMRVNFIDLVERRPYIVVRQNRVRIDECGQLRAQSFA